MLLHRDVVAANVDAFPTLLDDILYGEGHTRSPAAVPRLPTRAEVELFFRMRREKLVAQDLMLETMEKGLVEAVGGDLDTRSEGGNEFYRETLKRHKQVLEARREVADRLERLPASEVAGHIAVVSSRLTLPPKRSASLLSEVVTNAKVAVPMTHDAWAASDAAMNMLNAQRALDEQLWKFGRGEITQDEMNAAITSFEHTIQPWVSATSDVTRSTMEWTLGTLNQMAQMRLPPQSLFKRPNPKPPESFDKFQARRLLEGKPEVPADGEIRFDPQLNGYVANGGKWYYCDDGRWRSFPGDGSPDAATQAALLQNIGKCVSTIERAENLAREIYTAAEDNPLDADRLQMLLKRAEDMASAGNAAFGHNWATAAEFAVVYLNAKEHLNQSLNDRDEREIDALLKEFAEEFAAPRQPFERPRRYLVWRRISEILQNAATEDRRLDPEAIDRLRFTFSDAVTKTRVHLEEVEKIVRKEAEQRFAQALDEIIGVLEQRLADEQQNSNLGTQMSVYNAEAVLRRLRVAAQESYPFSSDQEKRIDEMIAKVAQLDGRSPTVEDKMAMASDYQSQATNRVPPVALPFPSPPVAVTPVLPGVLPLPGRPVSSAAPINTAPAALPPPRSSTVVPNLHTPPWPMRFDEPEELPPPR